MTAAAIFADGLLSPVIRPIVTERRNSVGVLFTAPRGWRLMDPTEIVPNESNRNTMDLNYHRSLPNQGDPVGDRIIATEIVEVENA
jgi:hypothetical protein